jgi:hypothetical protein
LGVQARWAYNCCRDVEEKLMLGTGPLKLFHDRSKTFKLEDGLKINAWSIRPSNLFILKFLKNNLHFQHTQLNLVDDLDNNIQDKRPILKLVKNKHRTFWSKSENATNQIHVP